MWAVSLAWPLITVLASGGVGTACTDTEYDTTIVEVERPPFNQPADTLNGFLGYYNVGDEQTTCGNCHATVQGTWVATKHADAYADLVNSGAAQSFCYGCHTVSELGNTLESAAGYNAVADSTYYDVQCESCHGPGLEHVESVLSGSVVRPLASIAVDTVGTNGCAGCHTGDHEPFVEQWRESKHGYAGDAYLVEGGRTGCQDCHEGRWAIQNKMGSTNDFVEKGAAEYQPIVCATCHNPHDATNEGQLRRPIELASRENLCVSCHSREGHPPASNTTRRGPHAAQGLLVIDEDVGWLPPNWEYDTAGMAGSHGTEANPRMCASCHVFMFTVTDQVTGDFLLNSVGHTFEAIPCLDAQGLPTAGPCADNERDFRGCAVSGCHGSAAVARTAFQVVRGRMNTLTDLLWNDLDNDSILETTDGGILPDVLAQAIGAGNLNEMNLYDNVLTPAEGAIWNAQLARTNERPQWASFRISGQKSCSPAATCTTMNSSNTSHKSSGEGAHNPFKLEALLLSSIDYLTSYYNLPAPPANLVRPQLTAPAGVSLAR
jgi:predicted CXXCH cytochrome family protein